MAISFQQAPIIANDVPTSTQFNQLADAFRERILQVGDIAWRIGWDAFAFTRLFRNPDESGLAFENLSNWLEIYAHLAPDSGLGLGIPSAGPTGYNRNSNPLVLFTVGRDPDILPESERLFGTGHVPLPFTPLTPAAAWAAGNLQRGAVTGGLFDAATLGAAPALSAAQYHFRILPNSLAKTGVSWGGFLTSPRVVDNDIESTAFGDIEIPVLELPFRYLGDDPTIEDVTYYVGGYGRATEAAWQPHLRGYTFNGVLYVLSHADGTVTLLDAEDWLLVPTGNGIAGHTESDLHNLSISKFCGEFRGSDLERVTSGYRVASTAAGFQEFLDNQYLLAPARGVVSGPDIIRDVVSFSATDPAAGQFLACNKGGDSWAVPDPFRLSAILVSHSGFISAAQLTVTVNSAAVWSGASIDGDRIALIRPALAGTIRVRVAGAVDGTITVELLELHDWRPKFFDAYLVCRGGGADILGVGQPERTGHDVETPAAITEALNQNTCLTSRYNSAGITEIEEISEAAVYQSSREFIRDHVRVVGRNAVQGYEVDGNGDSVIYLDRYALTSDYDVFDGIADAIEDAPIEGFSNEWCLHFSWIPDDTSSSEFQRAIYGDVLGYGNNPAFLFSEELRTPERRDLRAQITFGAGQAGQFAYVDSEGDPQNITPGEQVTRVFLAEAPPGASYAKGANSPSNGGFSEADSIGFFKSNQVYRAPYEIRSVVSQAGDVVKVTLKGRLQNAGNVATVLNSPGAWSFGAETYATDENRLMKYIKRDVFGSGEAMPLTIGDYSPSASTQIQGNPGNFPNSGAILPRITLIRLPSKCYEDGNDMQNPGTDARVMSDQYRTLAWYAQHVAETFVYSAGSTDACRNDVVMVNYRLEEALRVANGERRFEITDGTLGFGPLPNIQIKADLFNQFSRFVNLMTRLRIDIPAILQINIISTTGRQAVTPVASGGNWAVVTGATAPFTGLTQSGGGDGDWIPFDRGQASGKSYHLIQDGATWYCVGSETRVKFRIDPNALSLYAIPESMRDMVTASAGMFFEGLESWELYTGITAPGATSDARLVDPQGGEASILHGWGGTGAYATMDVTINSVIDSRSCQFLTDGEIVATDPGAAVLYRDYANGVSNIHRRDIGFTPANGLALPPGTFIDVPLRA